MKFQIIIILFLFTSILREVKSQNFVTPNVVTNLSEMIKETSGLANLNGEIWTHNDKGDDAVIYQLNPSNGNILRIVEIVNASNEDWEDIAYDENFVYIGDIGNNDGDRTDLKIYKVSRTAIESSDEVYAQIIQYSYNDQTSWEPNHNNNDFDCEALVSYGDNLFLFSKNWIDNKTRCYQLSKQPGTYIAEYQSTFDVECLITGAEVLNETNSLILIGYNTTGNSFTWVFENFIGNDFFSGNNTQLIWTTLTQIEGVCIANETGGIFISSEEFGSFVDPTLYHHDISINTTTIKEQGSHNIRINSTNGLLIIESLGDEMITAEIQILSTSGTILFQKQFVNEHRVQFPVSVPKGIYLVVLRTERGITTYKVLL